MLLKQHLDMIGRNEPIQRKARFWQSYVRALKGTDDMRAPEHTHYSRYPSRGIFQPLLDDVPSWPHAKSIYDDPVHPSERINSPGYRYLPISRETYGISPRNIYPHNYSDYNRFPRNPSDVFAKGPYKAQNEWDAHLDRLAQIDALYPEKYPSLYRPKTPTLAARLPKREWTPPPLSPAEKAAAFNYAEPFKTLQDWFEHIKRLEEFETLFPKKHEPMLCAPQKPGARKMYPAHDDWISHASTTWYSLKDWNAHLRRKIEFEQLFCPKTLSAPETAYPRRYHASYILDPSPTVFKYFDSNGQPIYTRGGFTRRPLSELLEPLTSTPMSRITRDPWWHEYPELRPYESPYSYASRSPFYLRNSFLSPVKRTYLWREHPIRPFTSHRTWY